LPISKATLYEFFPLESDELNNLKNLLNINKTKTKSAIRAKLFKSDKAGELLALYRLICDNEERQKLNQQYIEMRADVKSKQELTPDQINELISKFNPHNNKN
jgi:F0F1-type ATP synthase delta subunit